MLKIYISLMAIFKDNFGHSDLFVKFLFKYFSHVSIGLFVIFLLIVEVPHILSIGVLCQI